MRTLLYMACKPVLFLISLQYYLLYIHTANSNSNAQNISIRHSSIRNQTGSIIHRQSITVSALIYKLQTQYVLYDPHSFSTISKSGSAADGESTVWTVIDLIVDCGASTEGVALNCCALGDVLSGLVLEALST